MKSKVQEEYSSLPDQHQFGSNNDRSHLENASFDISVKEEHEVVRSL